MGDNREQKGGNTRWQRLKVAQHVIMSREAKKKLASFSKQSVCAHKLYKYTQKWSDGSHSSCQLASIISLVPQETREPAIAALLLHTQGLKPILLTMRANGKRLRRKKRGGRGAALKRATQNKHEGLLLSPINPFPSHQRWLRVPEQQKVLYMCAKPFSHESVSVCVCVCSL